jgi:hypothetical protein
MSLPPQTRPCTPIKNRSRFGHCGETTGEAERAESLCNHHGTGVVVLFQPLGDSRLERIQLGGKLSGSGAAGRCGHILGDGSACQVEMTGYLALVRHPHCFEVGRFTLTQSSWTVVSRCSRKRMSGYAATALVQRKSRGQFGKPKRITFAPADSLPLSAGKSPFSLDNYLSWMAGFVLTTVGRI